MNNKIISLNEVVIFKDQSKKMSVGIYPTESRNFIQDPYILKYLQDQNQMLII